MALNYSHRPMFPAYISENNLWSPISTVNGYLVEDASEKNGEGHPKLWHASQGEMEEWDFTCMREKIGRSCSPESSSRDVVDLLPSDPFGMDIETTFTAITGWLEDLEVDYGGYVGSNNGRACRDNYGLLAGWNLIWNNALRSQPFPSNFQSNENLTDDFGSISSHPQAHEKLDVGASSISSSIQFDEKLKLNEYGEATELESTLNLDGIGFQLASNEVAIMGLSNQSTSCNPELQFGEKVKAVVETEEAPHEAWSIVLIYLGVKELLSVERVCRSLHSEVRREPSFWKIINIDHPLNGKITDDLLLKLASRADGGVQWLSLVECPKVTDDGMRRVLDTNQRVTKLFVPGCTGLTIEGILNNIRTYNSNKDVLGIKHLRIGGLYGVTRGQFEEFRILLGIDEHKLENHKPHFYRRGNFYLPYDDDRAIDIEMCPRCEEFRLVYDCPAEACQVKDKAFPVCRACRFCIARCAQCGRCINDIEYEENFFLDSLCSDCFKHLHKYQDRLDKEVDRCGDCFNNHA